MSNEIIQSVIAYDNYDDDDDFQHIILHTLVQLHIFTNFPFHYFEDYLMTKLTLG